MANLKTHKYGLIYGLVLSLGTAALVGCESKSVESAPENIESAEYSLDDRLEVQSKTEQRLEQLEAASKKVLKVVDYIRKGAGKALGRDSYSSVDFVLDVIDSFRGKLPKGQSAGGSSQVVESTLNLPDDLAYNGCREVNARMTSHFNEKSEISSAEISLQSCFGSQEFVPVLYVSWDQGMQYHLSKEGLKEVFKTAFQDLVGDQLGCTAKMEKEDGYRIAEVQCEKLNVKIGKDVELKVTSFYYVDYGTKAVSASAQLLERQIVKANIMLSGSSDGEIDLNIQRLDRNNIGTDDGAGDEIE